MKKMINCDFLWVHLHLIYRLIMSNKVFMKKKILKNKIFLISTAPYHTIKWTCDRGWYQTKFNIYNFL